MRTAKNEAAALLRAGDKVAAAWLQSASPIAAEILAQADFDVLIVDLEHAPGDIATLIAQIQAMKGERAVPFVRIPGLDPLWIKRVLDAGACGLVVPAISSAEEAAAAVRAARYPPVGARGIAGSPRAPGYGKNAKAYFETANEEIFIFVQIETPGGVEDLDGILATPGVDGIFVGPMDLATTHGFVGNPDAPEVRSLIADIERRTLEAGKALATVAGSFEEAREKYDAGNHMVVMLHDTVTLGKLARREVSQFRQAYAKD